MTPFKLIQRAASVLVVSLFYSFASLAQEENALEPVSKTYAITNVNIVQSPGKKIELGTVVVKDGLIMAVGKGVSIPPEAVTIKADSMFLYAGFIDGLSRRG